MWWMYGVISAMHLYPRVGQIHECLAEGVHYLCCRLATPEWCELLSGGGDNGALKALLLE